MQGEAELVNETLCMLYACSPREKHLPANLNPSMLTLFEFPTNYNKHGILVFDSTASSGQVLQTFRSTAVNLHAQTSLIGV